MNDTKAFVAVTQMHETTTMISLQNLEIVHSLISDLWRLDLGAAQSSIFLAPRFSGDTATVSEISDSNIISTSAVCQPIICNYFDIYSNLEKIL